MFSDILGTKSYLCDYPIEHIDKHEVECGMRLCIDTDFE